MKFEFEPETGPFGQWARKLLEIDLAPIPTGGEDGKRPLLRNYTRPILNIGNVSELQKRFGFANCALVCGLSGIIVVDIDDPCLLSEMQMRFGDTPLIVKTGRGGYQLFYRGNPDVRPTNLRDTEGIKVEIKAASNIVVVPPSKNPITGNHYEFVKGGLDAESLKQLPSFRIDAVHVGNAQGKMRVIEEGKRNTTLWQLCMNNAHRIDSLEDLIDFAQTRNAECLPPLRTSEVNAIARSAWKYTTEGRNWFETEGTVPISKTEIHELGRLFPGNPVVLLLKLRIEHTHRVKRGEYFGLATAAMAQAGTLPGWNRSRFRKATTELLKAKLLEVVPAARGQRGVQYTLTANRPTIGA